MKVAERMSAAEQVFGGAGEILSSVIVTEEKSLLREGDKSTKTFAAISCYTGVWPRILSSNSWGVFILNPEAEEKANVLSNDEVAGSWETATARRSQTRGFLSALNDSLSWVTTSAGE